MEINRRGFVAALLGLPMVPKLPITPVSRCSDWFEIDTSAAYYMGIPRSIFPGKFVTPAPLEVRAQGRFRIEDWDWEPPGKRQSDMRITSFHDSRFSIPSQGECE